jgi:P27 family predicted phage terminase small subunit
LVFLPGVDLSPSEFSMSGPPPKPVRLKLIQGNPGHRKLPKEPQPASSSRCPPPPDYLTGSAADEWKRIAPELHRIGLLTKVDLNCLAVYCASFARWKLAEELLAKEPLTAEGYEGNPMIQHPLVRIASQAARDVLRAGAEFGLSPASRARISAGFPPGPSKFGDLLA